MDKVARLALEAEILASVARERAARIAAKRPTAWAAAVAILLAGATGCAARVDPAAHADESATANEGDAGSPQCCLVQGTAYCAGGYSVTYSDEGPDGGCSCVVVEDSSGVYWGPGVCL